MVTAFVDMVGLLMVIPLLPFYAERLGGGGLEVGLLVASFSVAQLLSAPLWGRVSDRYGRRPALLIGLGSAAVAYIVFAYASSLWLLLLSRLVQGAGGGTVGVIQAYVADATAPEDRAKSFGWLSASTNLGVMIGPVLGSLAYRLSIAAPGLLAAGLCTINLVFAWYFLRESHDISQVHASGRKVERSRDALRKVITHSGEPAPRLIWIYALSMGAFHGTTTILALYLALRFGVNEESIGYFFMYIGAIGVVARAGVLGVAVKRLGEARLSRVGTLLLASGLALIPFAVGYGSLAFAIGLVPVGTAFLFPCVTSLLSRVIGRHERGLYLGVQQTFGGVARVLGPIWAGWAYDNLGVGVPFWTSAAIVLATLALGLGMEEYTRPKTEIAAAEG
jgi:MFS family permease